MCRLALFGCLLRLWLCRSRGLRLWGGLVVGVDGAEPRGERLNCVCGRGAGGELERVGQGEQVRLTGSHGVQSEVPRRERAEPSLAFILIFIGFPRRPRASLSSCSLSSPLNRVTVPPAHGQAASPARTRPRRLLLPHLHRRPRLGPHPLPRAPPPGRHPQGDTRTVHPLRPSLFHQVRRLPRSSSTPASSRAADLGLLGLRVSPSPALTGALSFPSLRPSSMYCARC